MSDPTKGIVKIITGESGGQHIFSSNNMLSTSYGILSKDTVQASGVLIAPDEVLTAAHVVIGADGGERDYGSVIPGYADGSTHFLSYAISNVHSDPQYVTSSTSTTNTPHDFGLIHLSTAVPDGTVFAMASLPAGGQMTVSGYPSGLKSIYDSLDQIVTPDESVAGVFDGSSLGKGTDPRGSSGGPVWSAPGGTPSVYGVISGMSASEASKGFFVSLTTSDIAEIQGWMALDHTPPPATVLAGPLVTTVSPTQLAAAQGFSDFVVSSITSDAANFFGARALVMGDVADAMSTALLDGGDYDTMLQNAGTRIETNSSLPKRALAYLGGLLQGTSKGGDVTPYSDVNAMFGGGAVTDRGTACAAAAGIVEGVTLHRLI